MLLYIHIPFCRRKCHYCAFSSQVHVPEMEKLFLKSLKTELRIRADQFRGDEIGSFYLGGGTPTLISPSTLGEIIELAEANFSFAPDLEMTIEANPETIEDPEGLKALKALGINRLSLGVQSLDDQTLFKLGRGHTSAQALRAAQGVLQAGIDNLSVDLIWGLPGQTVQNWLEDLKAVVRLSPRHVSCYGLTLEPGTVMARQVEAGAAVLPDEVQQSRMYILGAEFLESEGFLQYEVSNFSRMGYACRHNTGYWEGEPFLGLGPSAVSSVHGMRWMNPPMVRDYARLSRNRFQGVDREEVKGQALINERIMLALRTSRGLKLSDYRGLTGHDFCSRFNPLIRMLRKNHLVRLANGYLRLTKNGMLVSNSIIERFIN